MRPRSLLIVGAIVLIILGAANATTAYLSRRVPARTLIAEIAKSSGASCIAAGNSLMNAAFDPAIFERRAATAGHPCPSLNAALGSTLPVEHDLLLRAGLRHNQNARLVYYGWFDRQLTTPPITKSADLIGNRIVGLLLDRRRALELYDLDWRSRVIMDLIGQTDLFLQRGQFWIKVERLREQLGQIGLRPASAGTDRFIELQPVSAAEFAGELGRNIRDRTPLSTPIMDMLAVAKAHGAKVIVIAMPLPPDHRERFYGLPEWHAYLAYVSRLIEQAGGEPLDATGWITDPAMFADSLHLNAMGAAAFSTRLAEETLQPQQ